jgi:hypothetical protein
MYSSTNQYGIYRRPLFSDTFAKIEPIVPIVLVLV